MKKLILILTISLYYSVNAFAGHGVERGVAKLDDAGLLNGVISEYLSKRLAVCASGATNEVFNVLDVKLTRDRVDNGIIDDYYTVDLGYSVNGENTAA